MGWTLAACTTEMQHSIYSIIPRAILGASADLHVLVKSLARWYAKCSVNRVSVIHLLIRPLSWESRWTDKLACLHLLDESLSEQSDLYCEEKTEQTVFQHYAVRIRGLQSFFTMRLVLKLQSTMFV
jgi:hypothetical protein